MRLYVEGGGDTASLKAACREGFSKFIERAGLAGKMPRIVACGSRADAYDSFCTAIKSGDAAMLLVDSEAPVVAGAQRGDADDREARDHWKPWEHLRQREGDGWDRPADSGDLQCHLMVQCMESWLLADRDALKRFFDPGFKENSLPAVANAMDLVAKTTVYQALASATRTCKTKSPYGKGEHSFKLLALVDPEKVQKASPWALRFVETLKARMATH